MSTDCPAKGGRSLQTICGGRSAKCVDNPMYYCQNLFPVSIVRVAARPKVDVSRGCNQNLKRDKEKRQGKKKVVELNCRPGGKARGIDQKSWLSCVEGMLRTPAGHCDV